MTMRKFIIYIIVIILLIGINSITAQASTISEAFDTIISELTDKNKLAYITNYADSESFLAINSALFGDNEEKYRLLGQHILFTNEKVNEETLYDRHVLILGGPCANKYWSWFSDETCDNWPYLPGEAVVKVTENKGYLVILIAGTDLKDTWEISKQVMNYKNIVDFRNSSIYLYRSSSKKSKNISMKCKPYGCFTVHYNANFIYVKNDFKYQIKVTNIDAVNDIVTFLLNDIQYILELGESIEINGISITPYKIRHNLISGNVESVKIHFNDSMDDYDSPAIGYLHVPPYCQYDIVNSERRLVYIGGDNVPFDMVFNKVHDNMLDLTLNGKEYRDIKIGDTINIIRDYQVKLEKINDFYGEPAANICFE